MQLTAASPGEKGLGVKGTRDVGVCLVLLRVARRDEPLQTRSVNRNNTIFKQGSGRSPCSETESQAQEEEGVSNAEWKHFGLLLPGDGEEGVCDMGARVSLQVCLDH